MNDKAREVSIHPALLGNCNLNPFFQETGGSRTQMFTAQQKLRATEMKTLTATEQKNNG